MVAGAAPRYNIKGKILRYWQLVITGLGQLISHRLARVQSTLTLLCCPGPAPAPAPPPSARPPLAAPVLVSALLLLSYVCTSAALLAKINSWAFVESFHFCFMSLLTVRRDPAVV